MSTTLDWYGCATFRLRTAGITVFLDAYIDRAPNAAGTGQISKSARAVVSASSVIASWCCGPPGLPGGPVTYASYPMIALVSRYSSKPSAPHSRPLPDWR